jgi:hypothetical protein
MAEIIIPTLAGLAFAIMLLALTTLPIGLVICFGLGIVWGLERCQRFVIRDLLVVTTAIVKILTLLSAVIRSSG